MDLVGEGARAHLARVVDAPDNLVARLARHLIMGSDKTVSQVAFNRLHCCEDSFHAGAVGPGMDSGRPHATCPEGFNVNGQSV